ncbi:hypothetical protein NDU88_005575 [Pleurodeles waltl]|uniref:Uncharacterized protein n=1 Tax=Pleurodeles waltl TaxID=8319 RepID=A0AAV7TXI4_PLEWA|nr:hypothetical protein NDU88_005575 [Pleurodeles waltl]
MDALGIDIGLMREHHKKLKEWVKDFKSALAMLKPVDSCIKAFQEEGCYLKKQVKVYQRHSSCKYVRVMGLLDSPEGPSMELYLVEWLAHTVLGDKILTFFSV